MKTVYSSKELLIAIKEGKAGEKIFFNELPKKQITKQGLTSKDIADFYLLLTQANDDQLEQLSYKIGQEIRKRHALREHFTNHLQRQKCMNHYDKMENLLKRD